MPKINFLRYKLWPVERTHADRQTDRDSENRRTYRIFLVIFFLIFLSTSGPISCCLLLKKDLVSFFKEKTLLLIIYKYYASFWNDKRRKRGKGTKNEKGKDLVSPKKVITWKYKHHHLALKIKRICQQMFGRNTYTFTQTHN